MHSVTLGLFQNQGTAPPIPWKCFMLAANYGFWSLIPRYTNTPFYTIIDIQALSRVDCLWAGLTQVMLCSHFECSYLGKDHFDLKVFVYVFVLVLQPCHTHSNCICSICHGLSPLWTGLYHMALQGSAVPESTPPNLTDKLSTDRVYLL